MKLASIAFLIVSSMACDTEPEEVWRRDSQDLKAFHLYRKGVQVGGFRYTDSKIGVYMDYDAGKDLWSPGVPCDRNDVAKYVGKGFDKVVGQPKEMAKHIDLSDQKKNMGVEWDKLDGSVVTYQGIVISPTQAIEMIQAEIPDFKKKFRGTVIGSDAECKAVMAEASKLDPAVGDRIIWRCVRPGDWSVKDLSSGKQVYPDGNPSICFQGPEGQMLHRQAEASGFPEAVRKAVKKYDSEKDLDLRKPLSPLMPSGNPLPLAALGIGGLAAFTIFTRKK